MTGLMGFQPDSEASYEVILQALFLTWKRPRLVAKLSTKATRGGIVHGLNSRVLKICPSPLPMVTDRN
jgi:hypothetical protein